MSFFGHGWIQNVWIEWFILNLPSESHENSELFGIYKYINVGICCYPVYLNGLIITYRLYDDNYDR